MQIVQNAEIRQNLLKKAADYAIINWVNLETRQIFAKFPKGENINENCTYCTRQEKSGYDRSCR